MYLFTTAASTSFQTGFIFGSSVMGSGPAAAGPLLAMHSMIRSNARFMAADAVQAVPTPEPTTLALLALGALGLLLKPRRHAPGQRQ